MTYRYLGQPGTAAMRPNGSYDDVALRFDQLRIAVGFSKCHVAKTCQLAAAILLENVEFIINRHHRGDIAGSNKREVIGQTMV